MRAMTASYRLNRLTGHRLLAATVWAVPTVAALKLADPERESHHAACEGRACLAAATVCLGCDPWGWADAAVRFDKSC